MWRPALDTVLQMLSDRSEYSGTLAFLDLDSTLLLVQIKISLVLTAASYIVICGACGLLKTPVCFPMSLCPADLRHSILGQLNLFSQNVVYVHLC